MVKRVSQTDRFVFGQLPAGVKTAHIVGDVSGHKAVLSSLDLLFESFAVVGELWLFVSDNITDREVPEDKHPEDEPPLSALFA